MKPGTGKDVVIRRGHQVGEMRRGPPCGPEIPAFFCYGRKNGLLRRVWVINCNDPRYETLNAVLALLPNRRLPVSGRVLCNEWVVTLEEYRAVCGKEGDLRAIRSVVFL